MQLRLGTVLLGIAVAAPAPAAPIAPGDLLMACEYWGITRIEPETGEQHPLGVGSGANYATLAEDADGLVWFIDNRWLVSIDPETGEHRLIVQLPNDFDGTNNGELRPEPGGTLLYAGDGVISRIDPADGSVTPVLSGAPLVRPLGIEYADGGDLLIADAGAGAIFRWNGADPVATVSSGNLLVAPSRVRPLADGDLLVLRSGRPVRVDPDTGGQSLYSDAFGNVTAAVVAANGDLIFSDSLSGGVGHMWRSTGPEAQPVPLLTFGQAEPIETAFILALTADDRVLIAGGRNEFTDGAVTDEKGALWVFDPATSALRVLSPRPPPGGIAPGADGRLFVANTNGTAFNLREVNPRSGETRRAAAGPLFTRPLDAAVEPDGSVLVLNGIPNGIPSVLRVDPDTGDTTLLSPTGQLTDPEQIAVGPDGAIFVSDFQEGLLEIDPGSGEQTLVPGSDELSLVRDLEVEASGALLAVESAGDRMWRVDPDTGARQEVGPPLDLTQIGSAPRGFGPFSALALGLDGTPYLSLYEGGAATNYAIYRAPTEAAAATRVAELPLCRGAELEVVRAVPEPAGVAGAAAALVGLALLSREARRR